MRYRVLPEDFQVEEVIHRPRQGNRYTLSGQRLENTCGGWEKPAPRNDRDEPAGFDWKQRHRPGRRGTTLARPVEPFYPLLPAGSARGTRFLGRTRPKTFPQPRVATRLSRKKRNPRPVRIAPITPTTLKG